MKYLIENGADLNSRTELGSNALLYTVENDDVNGLKLLLGRGASVKALGRDGYMDMTRINNPVIVPLLCAAGAVTGNAHTKWDMNRTVARQILHHLRREGKDCSLKKWCLKCIRSHLLVSHPDSNLYVTVPHLEVPSILVSYLLFDVPLGKCDEDMETSGSEVHD